MYDKVRRYKGFMMSIGYERLCWQWRPCNKELQLTRCKTMNQRFLYNDGEQVKGFKALSPR
jgi:hypothetical protein